MNEISQKKYFGVLSCIEQSNFLSIFTENICKRKTLKLSKKYLRL